MELALGKKGPIEPPPILDQPFQTVSEAVQSWKNVITAAHWDILNRHEVDGTDFYVGDCELGHIHKNGDVHLSTDKTLRDQLVRNGFADPFPYGGSYKNWTLFKIRNVGDTEHAILLFRLNYDQLMQLNT